MITAERAQLQLPLARRAEAHDGRPEEEQASRFVNGGRDRSVAYLLALEQSDGEGERRRRAGDKAPVETDDPMKEVPMAFAADTRVPVQRTKHEIQTLLDKHGVDRFYCAEEPERAQVGFFLGPTLIKITLPFVDGNRKSIMRKLMLLLALPIGVVQAHADEVVHVVGSGTYSNCWEWKQSRSPNGNPIGDSNAMVQWTLGYLAAASETNQIINVRMSMIEGGWVTNWLDGYCAKHPDEDTIYKAAGALRHDLSLP